MTQDARFTEEMERLLAAKDFQRAFPLLVDAYRRKLFGLAYSFLHNAAQAEEAAQDILVKVWTGLPYYDPSAASLSTWIHAIGRNTCISLLRHSAIRASVSLEEPGVLHAAEQRHHTPAEPTSALDCERLLATLPQAQRQILALFYLQGKSYEEVAAMLDMPVGTVKSHLHRARKSLAEKLGDHRP
ncbi:MAG: RNA polymerase sigma factor [Acidobacteriia bacterium]|nr:RNA polymerase sigma factor [Terriglobia bacterium]